MNLTVLPASSLKGKLHLPASKSYSIRAFLAAACGGRSRIIHPSLSDDGNVAIAAARALGASVVNSRQDVWEVRANLNKKLPAVIHVKESGTVLRLILPLLALRGQKVNVTGEGTLRGRPNTFLVQTLRHMGISLKGQGPKESVPIVVRGGTIKGGRITIDGTLSSQFISALLMTAPLLNEKTELRLTGKKIVSQDYITMTLRILSRSGIRVIKKNERFYVVPGHQRYQGLKAFFVPSDDGLAAFFLAAACFVPSRLQLLGVMDDDLPQADGHIFSFLKTMGARFDQTSRTLSIRGPFALRGGHFSLNDCPDLLPIMAVLALFAKGKTFFHDIAHARVKESDRVGDLRKELKKIGASIVEKDDTLIISPLKHPDLYKKGCMLDPHHDHRLAMAFAILGLKVGVIVKDMESSHKSYPQFVRDLKSLGARVNIH
ncbi:MAG: 3-phosphoshikimate 1-carboxyvinyltransferase [Candidatus Omnitrophota bacterium]|nr:3-phosphoshikimate 1-carboxyvinyltransferase [Candidatus Omnitrophota bacterium]